ncbi:Delta(24)-sterol C-methyltransferase [Exophiala xenobiotica]|uniref:Sterol 24-C-methyltransferase n=1 Tax=Vermiconidia calcicola TaxID=1690605 RepID=A0AAV9Q8B8_9PEZI|nr:Delta(24)-sterol C-methyltransferase [Exophiala xenobiotica]KAK5535977.1 Delta(24)-sterol C-methyltransferase [Vermiconidia calcicola]KAK5548921.1 Delta(24)-sterol C-methyltransferase [Chaetothyriales sp. CCFEE 6169]KAK5303503.1 Delta(24)-sterol C-methyltransferase [Exophiala xenobiotica]KAK5339713.1 Delta(24)-sterol C-methyltransferase [Exophiala xenobiotica]
MNCPPNPPTHQKQDFTKVVGTYTAHFDQAQLLDDDDDETAAAAAVTEDQRQKRQGKAAQVTDSYYEFATAAYEKNWSTRFHYAPFSPPDTLHSAQCFVEHRLALFMGLRPGMKVLDVGCGIGGPAREMAKLVGCEVVGITINQAQVDRAIQLTAQEGLTGKCTFLKADWHDLPFAPNSFDAAFAIEATCHASSLRTVYTNICRVLKPGGVFGVSEWVLTPAFDRNNSRHIAMRNRMERGNGISNLHTSDEARQAMASAGFDVSHEEDFARYFDYLMDKDKDNGNDKDKDSNTRTQAAAADRNSSGAAATTTQMAGTRTRTTEGSQTQFTSPVLIPYSSSSNNTNTNTNTSYSTNSGSGSGSVSNPNPNPDWRRAPASSPLLITPSHHRDWWWLLEGKTDLATTWTDCWTAWKMSRFARRAWYALVWTLEHLGYSRAQGVCEAMNTMADCVDSAVDAGKEGIFSPCWWFIARKPMGLIVVDGNMEGKRKQ